MGVLNSVVLMMMLTTGITEAFGTRIGLGAGVKTVGNGIDSAGENLKLGIDSAGENLKLGMLGSAALIGGVYLFTQHQPKKS
jgi:hypothetical protein